MGQDEYDITMIGPDGSTTMMAGDHDDAMRIVEHLMKASNGYHDIKIDPPIR